MKPDRTPVRFSRSGFWFALILAATAMAQDRGRSSPRPDGGARPTITRSAPSSVSRSTGAPMPVMRPAPRGTAAPSGAAAPRVGTAPTVSPRVAGAPGRTAAPNSAFAPRNGVPFTGATPSIYGSQVAGSIPPANAMAGSRLSGTPTANVGARGQAISGNTPSGFSAFSGFSSRPGNAGGVRGPRTGQQPGGTSFFTPRPGAGAGGRPVAGVVVPGPAGPGPRVVRPGYPGGAVVYGRYAPRSYYRPGYYTPYGTGFGFGFISGLGYGSYPVYEPYPVPVPYPVYQSPSDFGPPPTGAVMPPDVANGPPQDAPPQDAPPQDAVPGEDDQNVAAMQAPMRDQTDSAPPVRPDFRDEPAGTPRGAKARGKMEAPPQHLQELMKDGMESFASGDYGKAARLFLQSAMADRENIDGWLAYAVARFASGDYEMSAMAIRRGVKQMPEVVNATIDLRDRYGNREDFGTQLQALEDFVLAHTDQGDSWLVLGFIRHFSGQRDLSRRAFEVVQKRFEPDAELAGFFLNAKPPRPAPAGPRGALPQGGATDNGPDSADSALEQEEALRDAGMTQDSPPATGQSQQEVVE